VNPKQVTPIPSQYSFPTPDSEEYEIEAILDKRLKGGKIWYFVKWAGYGPEDNT